MTTSFQNPEPAPDLTPVPLSPERLAEIAALIGRDPTSRVVRAVFAPGSFTPRHYAEEPMADWQARAVMVVIGENAFAKRQLLAEVDRLSKRVGELETAESIGVEYGIRIPNGNVLADGWLTDRKDQESRLERYRDCWPEAVLASRPVRRGEWSEVTS